MSRNLKLMVITAFTLLFATHAQADSAEQKAINKMLDDFLHYNHQASQHDNFWADDLVYTSSGGTRFGKQSIMDGMKEAPAQPSSAKYSADEVNIRIFGSTAVLTFKLVADNADGSQQLYFNTGTLLKRNNKWQVVAWQATKIPQ